MLLCLVCGVTLGVSDPRIPEEILRELETRYPPAEAYQREREDDAGE